MRSLILILLFVCGNAIDAQAPPKHKGEFIFANVGVNGLVGGIGAWINRKPGEKGLKVFAKGFGQGCLGGAVQDLGRRLTRRIDSEQTLAYASAARFTNAIGASIVNNAAENLNFWERFHLHYGPVRLEYSFTQRKFKARLFTSAIYGMVVASRKAKLNWGSSLATGIMLFERDGRVMWLGQTADGFGLVSSIATNGSISGFGYYNLMAHEMMHVIQYDGYGWLNPMFKKADTRWKSNSKLYDQISKFLYFDLNGPLMFTRYIMQINQEWECRNIEREADYYSRHIHHPRCNH